MICGLGGNNHDKPVRPCLVRHNMEEMLSVVIPAYNEESRIHPTIQGIHAYLRRKSPKFEIIVVDDGSTDNTLRIVSDLSREFENIRAVHYQINAGKGYAVREGVLSSRGALLLLCDADQSTPIEEIEKLVPFLDRGYDIVIGSRALSNSDILVRQPWYRERMGKIFNILVRMLIIGKFKDTQCGFKLFRGDVARALFKKSLINGFSFDVEILFLAERDGYAVGELPIRWINSPHSRVRIFRDSLGMFFELLKIKANCLFGRYPASSKG